MSRWLRLTLATLLGAAALGVIGLITCRIALARVPQYRAALERLVRARTGLDVRFNELALAWGWRGPEAVFHRVELGEPGRSQVLLHASELIVEFDAWRALQSGELEAGRVTLVAPDIDIRRLRGPSARGSGPAPSGGMGLLTRWPAGRLDLEDATLTVPDPAHPSRTLRIGVRRARLERSESSWSADAQALLPQRLGRTATLTADFSGSPPPRLSSGTLSLEGRGVELESWGDILRAFAPGAAALPSSGVGNVKLHLAFARGQLTSAVAEIHADEVSIRENLPLGRVRGTFRFGRTSAGRWQLLADAADIGPLEGTSLDVEWREGGRGVRLAARAEARIEEVMAFIRRSPVQGLALAARSIQARGRARIRLESPDLLAGLESVEETASGSQRTGLDALNLSILVAADSVQVAPQLPPLESVSGTLAWSSGHLAPSALEARWLGGALALHLAERDRGEPALHVQAEGTLDARALVAATGIDTEGAHVAGRTPWRGELLWDPAADTWHARADASFRGIASDLPDPLAKPHGERAPFHLELSAASGSAVARVAGDNVRGRFELKERDDGLWLVRRGTLNFGSGAGELASMAAGPEGRLELRGTLASLDLPAWLIAWRTLSAVPEALPVQADLRVGELTLAGQRFAQVAIAASTEADFDDLELDSKDLAGEIHWPSRITPDAPVEVHLARLRLQDSGAPLALAPVLGALGEAAEVRADQVSWDGRALGALTAHVAVRGSTLLVQPLELEGARQDLEASVRCRSVGLCRARFELASRDASATLEAFGFRPEVASGRALLKGDLTWPRELAPLEPAWLAALSGNVSLEVDNGSVPRTSAEAGVPFALLGVPALLGEGSQALDFSRLSADYSVHEGSATTSDLRLDGAAQILLAGRIGLATRDYDCRAWILQGGAPLPQALGSLVSAPRVAAAWLALRGLIGSGDSGDELHLRGSWDAPEVQSALSTTDH